MNQRQPPPPQKIDASSHSYWEMLLLALYFCRFLVPAEGIDQGTTLWIAAGWLSLTTLRLWSHWRSGETCSFQWTPPDIAITLLVGGACLSCALAFFGEADRRATLNFFWEWLSLAALWFLMRELLQRRSARQLASWGLVVTVIALAGMGLWQHYIWYPQQSRDMTQLLALQTKIEERTTLTTPERVQYEKLRAEIGSELLTLEKGSREMLIARTRDSREPIGRFALANSFAALLITGWFASLFLCLALWREQAPRRALLIAGLALSLVTICLLLTKSRTAYVGLSAGIGWLGIKLLFHPSVNRRILVWSGLSVVAGAVILAGVLAWTGGLDREVLSEAPKSLSYRQEYWSATWKMIQDHPLFGVGPGNFRQHYFAYKVPGASEEILDPHNLILDVWANGGLVPLCGLLLFLAVWMKRLWNARVEISNEPSAPSANLLRWGVGTGLIAFSFVLMEEWLFEGFLDRNLVGLGAGWLLTAFLLSFSSFRKVISPPAALAAGVALLVHLLGAGGIGMPAIIQILFLLTLLTTPEQATLSTQRRVPLLLFLVLSGAAAIGCLWSGVVPVVTAARLMDQGNHEFNVGYRLSAAEKYYAMAAEADPLASAPHERLAGLAFHQWQRASGDDEEQFAKAIREKKEALSCNPRAAKEYLTLSEWWLSRFQREMKPEYAVEATRAAETGIRLYPNFSQMQGQYALSLEASGETVGAETAAKRALELDDLNRSRGHSDKVLPKRVRERLEAIAGEADGAVE